MQPVNFEGATVIKSNGEENCMHIYAQPLEYPVKMSAIDKDGNMQEHEVRARFWREYWMPSAKDLENINAGRGIWLELHCQQLTPVAVFTADVNGYIEPPAFDETLKPE